MTFKELKESGLIKSPAGIKFLEDVCDIPQNYETKLVFFGIITFMFREDKIELEECRALKKTLELNPEETEIIYY